MITMCSTVGRIPLRMELLFCKVAHKQRKGGRDRKASKPQGWLGNTVHLHIFWGKNMSIPWLMSKLESLN